MSRSEQHTDDSGSHAAIREHSEGGGMGGMRHGGDDIRLLSDTAVTVVMYGCAMTPPEPAVAAVAELCVSPETAVAAQETAVAAVAELCVSTPPLSSSGSGQLASAVTARCSVCLLYWCKSTNTDVARRIRSATPRMATMRSPTPCLVPPPSLRCSVYLLY